MAISDKTCMESRVESKEGNLFQDPFSPKVLTYSSPPALTLFLLFFSLQIKKRDMSVGYSKSIQRDKQKNNLLVF